jgi:hypothetical protein
MAIKMPESQDRIALHIYELSNWKSQFGDAVVLLTPELVRSAVVASVSG